MAYEAQAEGGGLVRALTPLQEAVPTALPQEDRVDSWRSLFRAHTGITARIERALSEEGLPPIGWFNVLWALHRSPRGRLRPRALVLEVTISKSGLTRLLDRLCDAGLTERVNLTDDRRGYEILLTEAGERTLRQMWPIYARELETHFSRMSEAEAEILRELLNRLEASSCESEDPECTT
jgi:DNA-binding MarR family transcriptional regulator